MSLYTQPSSTVQESFKKVATSKKRSLGVSRRDEETSAERPLICFHQDTIDKVDSDRMRMQATRGDSDIGKNNLILHLSSLSLFVVPIFPHPHLPLLLFIGNPCSFHNMKCPFCYGARIGDRYSSRHFSKCHETKYIRVLIVNRT